MVRNFPAFLALGALAAAPGTAVAETASYRLQLTAGVHCTVQYSSAVSTTSTDNMISLGSIREFCNAAEGYELIVSYTPGTLRGVQLAAGADRVTLNGSGEAILSRQPGPRILTRLLLAAPGEKGFDSDRLEIKIRPA